MNSIYLNFIFFATSTYLKLGKNFIILRVEGTAKSSNDILHLRQFVSHPFLESALPLCLINSFLPLR